MLLRRLHTGQMGRIDHQHRVKLESHRPRLHVADAGQEQGAENFLIAQPAANPRGHFFQQMIARRFFQHAHQRFNFRPELHAAGGQLRFRGR